jgi:predicted aspartyl protease
MPIYDSALFAPPAPLARVTLRHPENGIARTDVPMLIDTGADVTLLPQSAANELGITPSPDKSYEIIGFEGQVSLSSVVRVEMVFLGLTFRGQFLLIERAWGIIGRNVLNTVSLTFDGPNLNWDKTRKE